MGIGEKRRSIYSRIGLASGLTGNVRQWADALGIPLAYVYADNSDLAEVILAFGLLPEPEQRRLALELKERVSRPTTCTRSARKARTTQRTR